MDLLLDCHERIRSFLALARRIAKVGTSAMAREHREHERPMGELVAAPTAIEVRNPWTFAVAWKTAR